MFENSPSPTQKKKKLSNQLPIWLQSNKIRNRMITILNGNTKKIIDHLDEIKLKAKQINKLWQWFSYLDKRRNTVHLQGLFALALRY